MTKRTAALTALLVSACVVCPEEVFVPSAWCNALPFATVTPQWEDIRVPVSSMDPGATPPDPIIFGPGGSVRIRGFDGNATVESMDFSIQLPHSYKEGTNLLPHVHWCPTTNNHGNVTLWLDYYWLNIGGLIPALSQWNTGSVPASEIAWQHQVSDFLPIGGAGKLISSMLMCRISRYPAADSYPDDAGLLAVDFHFQLDSVGSRTETQK